MFQKDIQDAQWTYKSSLKQGDYTSTYQWIATLVVDGIVYDHVEFRCRGQAGRYAYGKNGWKFRFRDGHRLRLARDGALRRSVPGRA